MNILSYITPIKGKYIIDWIFFHTQNQTEYSSIANSMKRYLDTIKQDRLYSIDLRPQGTGCGERKINKPNLIYIKEN